jgi:putative SOS response-associated peptidase YedK
MCGRFSLRSNPRAVAALFDLPAVPDLVPRYNIAPTQPVAVVGTRPGGQGRGLVMMRWGLVPRWSKGGRRSALINARSETVLEKPTFRTPFLHRRCLIPADGFYEWARSGTRRQPYHFRHRDQSPFAFAGLWESWSDPETRERLLTCCILTTEANELVRPVHDRMPLIVDPTDFDLWLAQASQPDELTTLLRPCPADVTESMAVGNRVNSPKNDDPECVQPLIP